MKRVIASLILVASLAGPAAADQDVTFETVDEVARGYFDEPELRVSGIPQGETEPFVLRATLDVFGGTALSELGTACERMALLAMSRPGRYLFQITTNGSSDPGEREFLSNCRLLRR